MYLQSVSVVPPSIKPICYGERIQECDVYVFISAHTVGVHTYVLLYKEMQPGCSFTYGSCLCSRCGRRAAPGQNCRVTCLNTGRRGSWNVAVQAGLQTCCCRFQDEIREEDR